MTEQDALAAAVPLERVHARVHAVERAPLPAEPAPDGEMTPDDDAAAGQAAGPRSLSRGDVAPVAAVVGVGLLSGDLFGSLLAGATALGAVTLHRLATNGRFGFGDGFLAFRSDARWPRGVQEDDDFHWTWSAADNPGGARRRSIAR